MTIHEWVVSKKIMEEEQMRWHMSMEGMGNGVRNESKKKEEEEKGVRR